MTMKLICLIFGLFLCVKCNENNEVLTNQRQLSIVDDPKCEEIKKLCHDLVEKDDLLVLECVYSLEPNVLSSFSRDCQNIIWSHTNSLTDNENVRNRLSSVCPNDQPAINNCPVNSKPGSFLKCIANIRDEIATPECLTTVVRLESVAFYDSKWIDSFLNECKDDIDKYGCGLIDVHSLSQSQVLVCLQNHLNNIKETCRREVFKLSEIQAENIKLDRQLYMDCAQDHMRYCQQFTPGTGRVFTCLLQLRADKITAPCKKSLLRRQKLISQDFRTSRGLIRACKEDIKKSHCRRQTSNDKTLRLAQILLCLENVAKNGTVDPDCEVEMMEHRKMLMEDYRLSPEIMDNCKEEIEKYCNGLEVGGKTIHCLMDHVRLRNVKKRVRDVCQRALEVLVKEADVAEDWRVDPVLHEACASVARAVCRDVRGGDARVISCLMDNIGADHMTDECEDALIQIQYFVARDFKLDPQLYRACRYDAGRLCNANRAWEDKDSYTPSNAPLVLPCLYRYAYHKEEKMKLNHTCLEQIKRVMRQRAISVDLIPEVEQVCLDDLANFCFDKTKKGEEMQCLQKNMDDLKDECHDAVVKYTEVEAEDVELNPYIMKHCGNIMESVCGSELKNEDGDVMDCLISHKNTPLVKADAACRISIEHFQIISLKNYRFSYKFKMACKPDAERYCRLARTKAEVVTCLSERVTNDTINGIRSNIQKSCRQQLKAQLFQQRENIDFDPKLKMACGDDIQKHCSNVEHGSGQVLECLQSVQQKLSDTCEKELFKVKKQEMTDNSVDYALMTMCEDTIDQFCPKKDHEHVLDCLKAHKDEMGFNKKCRLVVMHRIIEQNSNYHLNPSLQENCKMDIKKFCVNAIIESKPDKDMNGPVIKCLKSAFKHSRLTVKCEKQMASILHDQAMDINLNPLLQAVCKDELETICKQNGDIDALTPEECLKNALLEKKIATPACQVEVAEMIEESQADIQVDPLLQQTCALDLLKFCDNVPQGNGRHVKCLQIMMQKDPLKLSKDCKNMLSKRLEMYRNAAQVAPPADFQELYNQVVASPSKHYFFLMILLMTSSLLVIGILCGRVTKRHTLLKNK